MQGEREGWMIRGMEAVRDRERDEGTEELGDGVKGREGGRKEGSEGGSDEWREG
jgi:hypothetical protein